MQARLVACETQHVVAALGVDGPGDGRLAAHRIDGDHAVGEGEHLQQCGNRGDLIGRGVGLHLAQPQPLRRGPRAHHVDGGLVGRRIKGPAERLPVDGDHVSRQQVGHRRDPREKGRLERLGVQRREDAAEGVVRRDVMRQGEEPSEPRPLRPPEPRNRRPVIGAADHRAPRDDQHILEGVTPRAAHPRVRQLTEVGGDRRRHGLGHGTSQCPPQYHGVDLGTSPY